MRVTKNENTWLFEILFEDIFRYDKWTPHFYTDFVKKYSCKHLAGVMTANMVVINDNYDKIFIEWLKSKGIDVGNLQEKQ